jgi:hypothetical protein
MPKRYPGWEGRLQEALQAASSFAYGECDSLVWPLQVVDRLCTLAPIATSDIAGPIVGAYSSADELQTYAAGRGWDTAEAACRELYGDPIAGTNAVKRAWRGDIVFRPDGGFGELWIVVDVEAWTPRPEGGLKGVHLHTLWEEGALAWHFGTARLSASDMRALCAAGVHYSAATCRSLGYPTPG